VGIIKDLGVGFAEQTFIVLDKEMVVGEFIHGDPHVEGKFAAFLLITLCSFSEKLGYKKISLFQSAR